MIELAREKEVKIQEDNLSKAEKKRKEDEEIKEKKELYQATRSYLEGVISVKDLIAPAGMRVQPSYLELNAVCG